MTDKTASYANSKAWGGCSVTDLEVCLALQASHSTLENFTVVVCWDWASNANSIRIRYEISLSTANASSSRRIKGVARLAYISTCTWTVFPLSTSTLVCFDTYAEIQLEVCTSAAQTFSVSSVKVSTGYAHIVALIIYDVLSLLAIDLTNALASVEKVITGRAAGTWIVPCVSGVAEFVDLALVVKS